MMKLQKVYLETALKCSLPDAKVKLIGSGTLPKLDPKTLLRTGHANHFCTPDTSLVTFLISVRTLCDTRNTVEFQHYFAKSSWKLPNDVGKLRCND